MEKNTQNNDGQILSNKRPALQFLIETWLSNFIYSSIAQKETEQKIRTLTNEKNNAFHLMFSEIRSAWDDVLSERIVYRLDPDKKNN